MSERIPMLVLLSLLLLLLAPVSCDRPDAPGHGLRDDRVTGVAAGVARDLASACPPSGPDDVAARDLCADRLGGMPSLVRLMDDPFVWGGQPAAGGYSLEGNTRFDPLVWRRLYLSAFSLGPGWSVERVGDADAVVHLDVRFRSGLPAGAYPYPFWHSDAKWESYSRSPVVHLVFRDGRLAGALRSIERDPVRPVVPHRWDGRWRWLEGSRPMPYVSLYSYLLRPGNPHAARLEATFRALDYAMREVRCVACHSPDNRGKADQLELLAYPAQALSGRHRIAEQLAGDDMPPEGNSLGMAPGIADPAERRLLLSLALDFAAAGDDALAWEDARTASRVGADAGSPRGAP